MRALKLVAGILVLVAVVWVVREQLTPAGAPEPSADAPPVPVEVAAIERGPFEIHRIFSGSLEAMAQFVVSPKVGGRVERLLVDLADIVERGQLVAELDDDEYEQVLARDLAELDVARATLIEARATLAIAERELERAQELREQGVVSDGDFDVVKSRQVARQAAVEVAKAQVARAEASAAAARIRLAYTRIRASWSGGADRRVVAERFVDEGDTVAANTPLLSIVELDPIKAVVFATEKDYGLLEVGQTAVLTTDAYPGVTFEGVLARVAPVFRKSSRQARVEVRVSNPEQRLKPGLFVRVEVTLKHVEEAVVVPQAAFTTRAGRTGVFVVAENDRAVWWPLEPGLRQGDRVQVEGGGLEGKVVTLGQDLLEDGSAVRIAETDSVRPAEASRP